MTTYLDRILLHHRHAAANDERDLSRLIQLAADCSPIRGFTQSLRDRALNGELAVISEIKRRSPSKGALRVNLDPAQLAIDYASGGAAALSVLTDAEFFGGSFQDLQVAREAVALPVLRKDFTVHAMDVCDARLMGADCILLIVAALSATELIELHRLAVDLGLDVLVEIHDEVELDAAMQAGATLIGVNQRDLVTFRVDHERAIRMAGRIPAHVVKVAESGVRGAMDARSLWQAGYDAILVGETLVTAANPIATLRELRISTTL